MALPTLTLDKTETDKIIALFGDQDAYLDWLAGALRDELERRAVRAAVDAALADIPTVSTSSPPTAVENLKAQLPEKDPPWVQPA